MKLRPHTTLATEAVLDHDELVFWLAFDEASQLLSATHEQPFSADD